MQTIKKYANRKLYHLNRKQYVTLDGIAALIQGGEQVQVLDNETGEDITVPVLTQVALQTRNVPSLPSSGTLADIIRAGGDTIAGVGRSLLANLGGMTLIDAEINRRIDRLEGQGDISSTEAQGIRKLLLQNADIEAISLPSRRDIERLRSQVDTLSILVEELTRTQDAKG